MRWIIARLFGRLPIGWLQLTHSRTRFVSALAGVAFANVLVFVQLGLMSSMATATLRPYTFFRADVMISAPDADSLTEGGNVARQWLLQALADPEVASGVGLFIANVTWHLPDKGLVLTTLGIDPASSGFLAPDIAAKADVLSVRNAGLLDRLSRGLPRETAAAVRPQTPLSFEVTGDTVTLYDTFAGGGGFSGDGYMVVSDQTFLGLFPARTSAAPDHLLLQVVPGADPAVVAERLRGLVSDKTLRIRTYAAAGREDLVYQQTRRPTGIIFGFGVVIGILVGLVIVYQVLSTDVADHLGEYATFKAMGYPQRFFLGVVLEEALVLGIFGFLPGLAIGTALLALMARATTLPLEMTVTMAVSVFVGTVVFSLLSGVLATRRLAAADPADLF